MFFPIFILKGFIVQIINDRPLLTMHTFCLKHYEEDVIVSLAKCLISKLEIHESLSSHCIYLMSFYLT